MKKLLTAVILLALLPANVLAQSENQEKTKDSHGTYIKAGLTHWEGRLWNFYYNLNGVNIDLETYFNSNHAQISGWSVGYRKDDLRYTDSGHMLNLRIFRTFNVKFADFKAGAGAEWGMPSLAFDKTRFENTRSGPLRYRHVYPVRNSNVPYVGTTKDGIFYPFLDVSLLKRKGIFLVEGGARVNLIRYGNDGYTVRNDIIEFDLRQKTLPTTMMFINFGIKLGH